MGDQNHSIPKQVVVGVAVGVITAAILAWLGLSGDKSGQDHRSGGGGRDPFENFGFLSGWTTTFEDHQVLQGQGGTLAVYPTELAAGFQVYVQIPRERIANWRWVKDGDGHEFIAAEVKPP